MGPDDWNEPGEYELLMSREVFEKLYGCFFLPITEKDQSDSSTIMINQEKKR